MNSCVCIFFKYYVIKMLTCNDVLMTDFFQHWSVTLTLGATKMRILHIQVSKKICLDVKCCCCTPRVDCVRHLPVYL
jgi:hypothetical protein